MFDDFFKAEDAQQVLLQSADTIEHLEATRLLVRKNRANLLGIKDVQNLRSLILEVEHLLGDAILEAHVCMLKAMEEVGDSDE